MLEFVCNEKLIGKLMFVKVILYVDGEVKILFDFLEGDFV